MDEISPQDLKARLAGNDRPFLLDPQAEAHGRGHRMGDRLRRDDLEPHRRPPKYSATAWRIAGPPEIPSQDDLTTPTSR